MGWFFTKKSESLPTEDMEKRVEFLQNLQALTNKIHATGDLEHLMLDLTKEICDLFNCDRLTLYAIGKNEDFIFSRIKAEDGTEKDLRLPVNAKSIAGWVAQSGRTVRIHDVYDKAELKAYADDLCFSREVDQATGYRTKQMLAAPIFKGKSNELLGVIQLLNNRADDPFTKTAEHGLAELCETLAVAFTQRMKPVAVVSTKFNPLVDNGVISQPELELAIRSARRQDLELEDVLIDEFKIALPAVGSALAATYRLPYEGHNPQRKRPGQLLVKLDREFVETNRGVPIEEDGSNIVVLTTDPDFATRSGVFKQLFPYSSLFFRVTTRRELRQTADQFLGTIR